MAGTLAIKDVTGIDTQRSRVGGAHSLTKCRHAGRTMKTIRTAENFQKPHGGDLVPSSGDREDIRDLGSSAPETYPRHGSSS